MGKTRRKKERAWTCQNRAYQFCLCVDQKFVPTSQTSTWSSTQRSILFRIAFTVWISRYPRPQKCVGIRNFEVDKLELSTSWQIWKFDFVWKIRPFAKMVPTRSELIGARECPLTRFHLHQHVVPFAAKRDSENIIDYKTRRVTWFLNDTCFMLSIVYYWLKNAIRFLWENIRRWCVICVCLQRESELGVTQELALQSRALYKSDISGLIFLVKYRTCTRLQEHIRRPESPVPIEYWVAHDLYFSRTTW